MSRPAGPWMRSRPVTLRSVSHVSRASWRARRRHDTDVAGPADKPGLEDPAGDLVVVPGHHQRVEHGQPDDQRERADPGSGARWTRQPRTSAMRATASPTRPGPAATRAGTGRSTVTTRPGETGRATPPVTRRRRLGVLGLDLAGLEQPGGDREPVGVEIGDQTDRLTVDEAVPQLGGSASAGSNRHCRSRSRPGRPALLRTHRPRPGHEAPLPDPGGAPASRSSAAPPQT